MATRSDSRRLARKAGLLETQVGNHTLVFDSAKESVYALNPAASLIWHTLAPGASAEDVAGKIRNFFVPASVPDDLARQVSGAIDGFEKIGILTEGGAAGSAPASGSRVSPGSLRYENPNTQTYTMEWLKKNHPGNFHAVMFSDTWGPGDGPH